MSDVVVTVRLPAEMNARIVELTGSRGRSRFIRKAIEAGLRGHRMVPADRMETGERVRVKKKKSTVRALVSASDAEVSAVMRRDSLSASDRGSLSPDGDALMTHLLSRPRSERDIARDLGWMPGRVEKVVRELSAAGAVVFDGGLVSVHLG